MTVVATAKTTANLKKNRRLTASVTVYRTTHCDKTVVAITIWFRHRCNRRKSVLSDQLTPLIFIIIHSEKIVCTV